MPKYIPGIPGQGPGHPVFGRGPRGYLVTVQVPNGPKGGERLKMLTIECHTSGMIEAVAMVEEMTTGEVICCLRLREVTEFEA